MKESDGITVEALRELLEYDPETGLFRWSMSPKNRAKAGRQVGTVAGNGRVMIRVLGKPRLAHRIAWAIHYGKFPAHTIDHINRDPADNRIVNLRDVPQAVNSRNHPQRPILVGPTPTADGRWQASVHQYGGSEPIGVFDTIEEATAAWETAKKYIRYPDEPRPKLRPINLKKHGLV